MGEPLSPVHSSLVTTYVRQQRLFDDDDDDGETSDDDGGKPTALHESLRFLGLRPQYSRARTAVRLMVDWEGRDALLQLAQSLTLLVYSLAPVRRRQLHIASEVMSNTRKVFVLGRWIVEAGGSMRAALLPRGKTGDRHDDDESDRSSASSLSDEDDSEETAEKRAAYFRDSKSDLRHNSMIDDPAVRSWRRMWERRMGMLAERLTMVGEGCEVAALLGGSSVLWRVLGGTLAARQRKGLERIALVFLCVAFAVALRHVEWQRRRRVRKLRAANQRLLVATDQLAAEADAKTLFRAHRFSSAHALLLHRRQAQADADAPYTPDYETDAVAAPLPEKDEEEVDASLGHIDSALRRADTTLFLQRKKMQLLLLERTALRAELLFVIAELVWPRHNHTRLEGWTGLIAALCHISRLAKEARWRR